MRQVSHHVSANGLTHFVRDSGEEDAPAAILLHGFPDSSAVWDKVTPHLVDAGFRIIAPDLRGFGETEMAAKKADYDLNTGSIPDILKIADTLNIKRAHIVGHDFGAPVAWGLAARHADIFTSLTAISAGHVRAYLSAGPHQWRMSWYILFHQMRGLCEALYRSNDWALFRKHWSPYGDMDEVIANLSRPGRLTAGLDWYRANISLARMIRPPPYGAFGKETVHIPTLGIWSDGEKYLGENQMTDSKKYVRAPWRYERIDGASHWIPYDAPERLASLLVEHWRVAAGIE